MEKTPAPKIPSINDLLILLQNLASSGCILVREKFDDQLITDTRLQSTLKIFEKINEVALEGITMLGDRKILSSKTLSDEIAIRTIQRVIYLLGKRGVIISKLNTDYLANNFNVKMKNEYIGGFTKKDKKFIPKEIRKTPKRLKRRIRRLNYE